MVEQRAASGLILWSILEVYSYEVDYKLTCLPSGFSMTLALAHDSVCVLLVDIMPACLVLFHLCIFSLFLPYLC